MAASETMSPPTLHGESLDSLPDFAGTSSSLPAFADTSSSLPAFAGGRFTVTTHR
jgi:hypothetical protein